MIWITLGNVLCFALDQLAVVIHVATLVGIGGDDPGRYPSGSVG
jgi:hypothetical protein